MRRENKLALIVGFSVLLVVAVLVSDHLSKARQDEVVDGLDTLSNIPDSRAFTDPPVGGSPMASISNRSASEDFGTRLDREGSSRFAMPSTPIEAPEPTIADNGANQSERDIDQPRLATQERTTATGPMELYNGSGQSDSGRSSGGIAGITGIDRSVIEDFLNRRDRAVLAQPAPRTPDTRSSSSNAKADSRASTSSSDRPTRSASIPGYIERDNRYVVQPGDSLFEICETFYGDGTKWRELAAINVGKVGENGRVYVGVALTLLDGTKVAKAAVAPPTKVSSDRSETRSYTVKKGDTLSQIVQREVGSVRHLDRVRALNPWLKDQKDNVRIGQKLTLPILRHASARGH